MKDLKDTHFGDFKSHQIFGKSLESQSKKIPGIPKKIWKKW